MNRRPLLTELGGWADRSPDDVGLLTAASSVTCEAALARAREQFLFVEVVEDYASTEVEALILDLCRRWDMAGLVSTAEIDVLRCARVRERLGIPGQRVASAEAYRNKYVMKQHAARQGVAVADMALLTDSRQLARFIADDPFPVLLKPLRGAASIGIVKVGSAAEWDRALAGRAPATEYLVEKFVVGEMYHVDGLMRDGRVVQSWPSRYLYTQWETMYESRPNLSAMLAPPDPRTPLLCDAAASVVRGLPAAPELLPFHAEFFIDAGGRPVLCEIACRAGGAGITDAYELSYGLGMNEASVSDRLGMPVEPTQSPPGLLHGWGWFPPRRGVLARCPDTCGLPGARRYARKGRIGQQYAGPTAVTHSVAELVFALDDGDVEKQLREVDNWWAEECIYA
ncbi:ATP-grasp domain-containing protein [Streptomyces sp. NBC_01465]|uniref:ATP-grasp domain-containing protein n=1 Tax=Streptomyces sp. NBC_01465 TaxID=2903878 RepID=UPI002E330BF4|nr:hypothetical protein [Streptomyces sp. NBC_01465]